MVSDEPATRSGATSLAVVSVSTYPTVTSVRPVTVPARREPVQTSPEPRDAGSAAVESAPAAWVAPGAGDGHDLGHEAAVPDDEAAAAEAAADGGAWAAVWAHRPYLLAVARRRVGWHDAEDVVQEALLRALRLAVRPDPRLRAWLTTTVIRLCVDRQRSESAQRRRLSLVQARPEARLTPSHEDDVVDREEARWLAGRVRELPPRQAEAVLLRAEGLSVAEVGDKMGVPPKAVESLLGRARRFLRNVLVPVFAVAVAARTLMKRKVQLQASALVIGTCFTLAVDVSQAGVGGVTRGAEGVARHWTAVAAANAPWIYDAGPLSWLP